MNRREFCRRLAITGGTVALAPLINACEPLSQLAQSSDGRSKEKVKATPGAESFQAAVPDGASGLLSAEDSHTSRVALIKTSERSSGVREAIRLLGIGGMTGDRVLLKPNFNSADESPGSTHVDTLRTLVEELNELGARTITIADRSGMGDTREVMRQKGIEELASEMGFNTAAFEELEESDWTMIRSGDFYWKDGFPVPRMLLDADRVIQTCNLKTHQYGGHFTMALKNSVGIAAKRVGARGNDYMAELHGSSHQRAMIAEINTAYKPSLIVMDGVEAFVSGGPARGQKAATEVILAGTDPIAIDAVGVAILRLFGTTKAVSRGSVFGQEQIARAVELGLGVSSPDQIQFVTKGEGSDEFAAQIMATLVS